MAKILFLSAVDMTGLNFPEWLGTTPTATSATSMTFSTPGQTVVIGGSGFSYFFGFPVSGTVTGFTADGIIDAEVTKLNLDIADITAAVSGPNPVVDSMNLLLGGNDGIFGSTGADVLLGLAGKDSISGNKGADVLFGGAGRDVLTGGRGDDTFTFDAGDSSNGKPDRITDLSNSDWIDLSSLGITMGDISATYDAGSDTTTFAIDYKGAPSPDMSIIADGDHTDFSHFILS